MAVAANPRSRSTNPAWNAATLSLTGPEAGAHLQRGAGEEAPAGEGAPLQVLEERPGRYCWPPSNAKPCCSAKSAKSAVDGRQLARHWLGVPLMQGSGIVV
jgi:hypothetical protein